MSQRERQDFGGMAATMGVSASPIGSPNPRSAGDDGNRREGLWEHFFTLATPAQQAEMLALANRQGLLYVHQLPKVGGGTRTSSPHEDNNHHYHLLTQLAAGQTGDLQPLRSSALALNDGTLDASQAEAVARALATPDVFLLQGLPGTGKSRVVAEIIRQAAQRGERILFLAATTPALDCVLAQLESADYLFPLRCLDPNEQPNALGSFVRSCTLNERICFLREQLLPKARKALEEGESNCRRRQQEEAIWPRLEELAGRVMDWQQRFETNRRRCAEVPGEVEKEVAALVDQPATANGTSTFHQEIVALMQQHRQAKAELAEARARASQEKSACAGELELVKQRLAGLQPLAAAKSAGRWWSWAWWRALFQPGVLCQAEEWQRQKSQAEETLQACEQKILHCQDQEEQQERRLQQTLGQLLATEKDQRLAWLAQEEDELRAQQQVFNQQWQQVSDGLEWANVRPAAMHSEAVARARVSWQVLKKREEEAGRFAGHWARFLEEAGCQLGERLPASVNLVAATVQGFARDKTFGSGNGEKPFDLLILEEADQVAENDCLKAARRAARWILVGEPSWTEARTWSRPPGTDRQANAGKPSALARHSFFQRLWDHLHCDPGRLPYSWGWEGDRLGCRLRPLSSEQRHWLEKESLADAPDIELRILTLPRTRPVLAEVVFPPTMTVPQAKEFIFRELQELPIQPGGRSWCWLEDNEHLILRLAEAPLGHATPVTVAPGVREWVGTLAQPAAAPGALPQKPAAWFTCQLEFDKAAGWQRDLAHAWVHSHLPLPDLGRTVSLQVPYRMVRDLSHILSDLLFHGTYVVPREYCPAQNALADTSSPSKPSASCAVEFVPVPPLRKNNGHKPDHRHKKNAHAKPSENRLPVEGAGLELDLTAARPGDRLPPDLRGDLPTRGFVNYPEAQAVVRKLEALVRDAQVHALANHPGPIVAVIALYAAQAELIRRLMKKSAVLGQSTIPVVVGLPGTFRHREFPIVLLSLTRSHAHRPVSYGEQAAEIALAMTRACSQVILFGDAGTLVRRSRWHGRFDHLDEAAAAREGQLVGDLVRYLQGQGRHSRAFLLCESNGP